MMAPLLSFFFLSFFLSIIFQTLESLDKKVRLEEVKNEHNVVQEQNTAYCMFLIYEFRFLFGSEFDSIEVF